MTNLVYFSPLHSTPVLLSFSFHHNLRRLTILTTDFLCGLLFSLVLVAPFVAGSPGVVIDGCQAGLTGRISRIPKVGIEIPTAPD